MEIRYNNLVNWFKNYGKVTMRNNTLKLSVRININAAVYRCGTVEKNIL